MGRKCSKSLSLDLAPWGNLVELQDYVGLVTVAVLEKLFKFAQLSGYRTFAESEIGDALDPFDLDLNGNVIDGACMEEMEIAT